MEKLEQVAAGLKDTKKFSLLPKLEEKTAKEEKIEQILEKVQKTLIVVTSSSSLD